MAVQSVHLGKSSCSVREVGCVIDIVRIISSRHPSPSSRVPFHRLVVLGHRYLKFDSFVALAFFRSCRRHVRLFAILVVLPSSSSCSFSSSFGRPRMFQLVAMHRARSRMSGCRRVELLLVCTYASISNILRLVARYNAAIVGMDIQGTIVDGPRFYIS